MPLKESRLRARGNTKAIKQALANPKFFKARSCSSSSSSNYEVFKKRTILSHSLSYENVRQSDSKKSYRVKAKTSSKKYIDKNRNANFHSKTHSSGGDSNLDNSRSRKRKRDDEERNNYHTNENFNHRKIKRRCSRRSSRTRSQPQKSRVIEDPLCFGGSESHCHCKRHTSRRSTRRSPPRKQYENSSCPQGACTPIITLRNTKTNICRYKLVGTSSEESLQSLTSNAAGGSCSSLGRRHRSHSRSSSRCRKRNRRSHKRHGRSFSHSSGSRCCNSDKRSPCQSPYYSHIRSRHGTHHKRSAEISFSNVTNCSSNNGSRSCNGESRGSRSCSDASQVSRKKCCNMHKKQQKKYGDYFDCVVM